ARALELPRRSLLPPRRRALGSLRQALEIDLRGEERREILTSVSSRRRDAGGEEVRGANRPVSRNRRAAEGERVGRLNELQEIVGEARLRAPADRGVARRGRHRRIENALGLAEDARLDRETMQIGGVHAQRAGEEMMDPDLDVMFTDPD